MTVDEVMKDLRDRHEAEIQAVLDRQKAEGGTVDFTLGMNFRSQAEIDAEAKAEAMKPENILARIEALEKK